MGLPAGWGGVLCCSTLFHSDLRRKTESSLLVLVVVWLLINVTEVKVHKGTETGLKALQGCLFPEECEPRKKKKHSDLVGRRFMQELFSLCRLHPSVTALSHGRRDTSVERDISAFFKKKLKNVLIFLFVYISFFLILFFACAAWLHHSDEWAEFRLDQKP